MQDTALRLDKVQAPSLQALGAHSKKLTVELDDKAVALAVAQASQELALRSSILTSRIPFHSFSNIT
jgi:hypothetical protein